MPPENFTTQPRVTELLLAGVIKIFRLALNNLLTEKTSEPEASPIPLTHTAEALSGSFPELDLELRPGWRRPIPETLPQPTYVPIILAVGIVFLALGVVTVFWVSLAGFILLLISLVNWVRDLRHEEG